MITINLAPPPSAGSAAARWHLPPMTPRQMILGAIAGLGVVTVGLVAWRQVQERALTRLTAEWDQLKTPRQELETVRASAALLDRQDQRFKQLRTAGIRWAPCLNLLSDAMVPGVWFTRLTVEPSDPVSGAKAPAAKSSAKTATKTSSRVKTKESSPKKTAPGPTARLVVSGVAMVPAGEQVSPLGAMLDAVKRHPQFSTLFDQVEVKSAGRGKIGRQEVTEFTLVFDVKGVAG